MKILLFGVAMHTVMNNVFVSKVGTFLHFSRNSCAEVMFFTSPEK